MGRPRYQRTGNREGLWEQTHPKLALTQKLSEPTASTDNSPVANPKWSPTSQIAASRLQKNAGPQTDRQREPVSLGGELLGFAR